MGGYKELVEINPQKLTFLFELQKEIQCSFKVANLTNEHVAFKMQVKPSTPKKYRVSPNHGLLQPGFTETIVVTMLPQTEAPVDMICKDTFLLQTIVATKDTIVKEIKDVANIMRSEPQEVHRVTLPVAYVQKSDQGGSTANTSIESMSRGLPNISKPRVHFEKPETIEEEEEEVEGEESISVSSQNPNEMDASFRAEVQKRKKIEKELAILRKESEENKKLIKELQQNLGYTQFEFEKLKEVTNNFSDSNNIGKGGFSVVYKGILDGNKVAIKKLTRDDEKGFKEEIETLSKVRHPNIITLIGACNDKENRLLVYEYLPNGSLEDHLTVKDGAEPLPAQARIRVALDICCALVFLHSIKRVHGDLKPDNVLLDSNNVSKLSDFGTCRALEHSKGTTTLSYKTVVKGTLPYMDPNFQSKYAGDKGDIGPWFDVYSFGVVLLRLATGRDVHDAANGMPLKESVERAIHQDKFFDKFIDVEWPSKEAPEKMARLGLRCFDSRWRPPVRPNATEIFNSLMDIASNK